MKHKAFILVTLLCIVSINSHGQSLEKMSSKERSNYLTTTARFVAEVYGPSYVPFFKKTIISDAQIFDKSDYGDELPEIKKCVGREYYTIIFTYDKKVIQFAFDYAARVRIWKDTGEPLDVIFGNGFGRNFLISDFMEQTNCSVKTHDLSKIASKSINVVPLETVEVPKSIWTQSKR